MTSPASSKAVEALLLELDKWERVARAAGGKRWRFYNQPLRVRMTRITEVQHEDGEPVVAWSGFDGVNGTRKEVNANARHMAYSNPAHVLSLIAKIRAALSEAKSEDASHD